MPELNAQKISLNITPVGELKLRGITVGDSEKFFRLVEKKLTDKDFVTEVLFNQLVEPKILKEDFPKLTDENLKKIAKALLESETHTFKTFKETGTYYSDFRKALTESLQEDLKRMSDLIAPFIEPNTEHLKTMLATISDVANSFKAFQARNATVFQMIGNTNKMLDAFQFPALTIVNDLTQQIPRIIKSWDSFLNINAQVKSNYLASLGTVNVLPQLDSINALYESSQQIARLGDLFTHNVSVIPSYPPILREKIERKIYGSVNEIYNHILRTRDNLEKHYIYEPWEKFGELLKDHPERICEVGMALALENVLSIKNYKLHRQPKSGNGIMDIIIDFWNGEEMDTVVIELKIFRENDSEDIGIKQTLAYLKLLKVTHGFRVIFNSTKKSFQESTTRIDCIEIKDIIVNINPTKPSDLK